ncbi:MAG: hypothetical protein JXR68_00595 [Bacteroidales bacterium]|nr:hypothetical protein [Bacteroidales bacterium]
MKKYFFLLFFVLTTSFTTNAQQWKRNPASIVYGNGTNNFMGDLGGGKKIGAHFFGIRDLDYQVTRPTWQLGYRYRFHEFFTFRVNYSYALISGKDAASGSFDRRARNLSFRSGIYELTTQVEYYFIKEKGAQKSSFNSLKGFTPLSAYVFVGGGALYYNPKAKHPETGKWIALQPLGTEGQFAVNSDGTQFNYTSSYRDAEGNFAPLTTPEPYKRIAGVISMGIGVKYDLNKLWSIGLEISNRYTSTDYLDDTHDKYFNYSQYGLTPPSEYTTLFSDRHLVVDYSTNTVIEEPGTLYLSGKTMRGEPDYNDAYIFAIITVYYKLGGSGSQGNPKYRGSRF